MCYTIEALKSKALRSGHSEERAERFEEKDRKKFEKLLKNPLTKRKRCAIIEKLTQRANGSERKRTWSLKIEQQDEFVLSKR